MNIAAWLRSLGLAQYEAAFSANAIDASVLPDLTDTDLEKLGVLLGHRKRMLRAIAELNAAPAVSWVPGAAERRQLTVMFVDLVGSTGLSARLDLEDLRDMIAAYQRSVASTVEGFGGYVAKYMGDGVLVYFGYPRALEDDAERAVRAALALTEPTSGRPPLRVGIETGMVVVGDLIGAGEAQERGVVGKTPNLAARLQGIAEPDSVVIGPGTRRLLGTLFELRDLGAVKLRGVAASVPAWRVLRPAAVDSRFEAFRGSAPLSPLIGREDDLAVLLRRWERAWGGQGQLVLLSGEPGIGKSRLIAALLDAVGAAPHTRLRYFCAPHHSESPLHPFIAQLERAAGFERGDRPLARLEKLDALLSVTGTPPEDRGLIAELLSLPVGGRYPSLDLTPQRRRRRLLEALLAQLSALAATQPVLAVVEDVHWADPSSRELLDQVVAHLRDQRLLLIVTFRPEFAPPWIGQQQVTSLTLSRLNRKDSETLAGVTADGVLRRGLLETIVVQADGVPLFIEELTKAVLETSADHSAAAIPASVPATLHASLMARLDRLPAAREVAQIGAVIGREFPHTLLAATDLMPAAELTRGLEELIASGLAVSRGMLPDAIYTFNHALTRDVAYTSMLRRRRQTCHQRIAVVLEEFDDGFIRATEPELLAYHFQEAEEFSAALEYWIAAGDAAEQRGANQEAAAHYGAARQLIERAVLPASDRARLPELLMKLGNAQVQEAGYNSEDVMRIYQEARDAALALDQQDEAAEAGLRIAVFLLGNCRHHEAMEIGNTILNGNQDRLRPETLVHAWVMLGGATWHVGEFEQSLAYSERAVELDDEVNCTHKAPWAAADPAIVARDYVEMSSRMLGYFGRSLAVSEQAMEIALERGHMFSITWASVCRISALRSFGRCAEAVACADRAIEMCEKYGFYARIGNVLLHRGPALFELGDEERGLAELQQGIAQWRKANGLFMLARNMTILADYQFRAKQLEQARASLSEAERLAEATEEKDHLAEIIRLRGRIWQSEGNHEEARRCFARAIARSREQRARLFELHAARDLVKLGIDTGSSAEPLENLRAVVDWFPDSLEIPVLSECRALLQ